MANEFLVSVADAILRDPTTGNAIAYSKANIESSFTLSTAETEVRGGINNPLLYTYIHDRSLAININQATFDKVVLGLNVGQLSESGAVDVTQTDCIVLSGGSGTLSVVPTADTITVFLPNGLTEIVTATAGSNIYVSAGASQKVDVVYTTSVTADQITIESTTPPSVVDLTMIAEVRDNTGAISEYLQISVPRFQVMGNYTLALAANGVSQQALSGKALLTTSTDCTTADYYAKVTWIPVSATSVAVSSIAAIPSTIAFTGTSASWPKTQQISVLGIRGGIYANANITSSCTFAKSSGSANSNLVVGTTGLVTAGSSGSIVAGNYINYFKATYYTPTTGSLLDYVEATAVSS